MTPRYKTEDIARQPGTGHRYLVLHVGYEAYFVRDLGDLLEGQHRETAWAHGGMEALTELEPRAEVGLPSAEASGAV
jgi:hypothetical protein